MMRASSLFKKALQTIKAVDTTGFHPENLVEIKERKVKTLYWLLNHLKHSYKRASNAGKT